MIYSLVLLVILVTVNGFFAASELAFISVNEMKLRALGQKGNRKANQILKLKENPNKYLSTIQIGVSIASIFSGVFASEAFATQLTEWILTYGDFSRGAIKTFSMIFITLAISYVMLLFGELVPKRIAMANPKKFALLAIYPLTVIAVITTPVVKFLSVSTNFVLRLIGINPDHVGEEVTEELIRVMVKEGKIASIEKEMIESIFEFDDTEVADIMTHRTKIVAIDAEASFEDILSIVNEERFTRYPVYEKNIDNIIGIIHSRELLRYAGTTVQDDFIINDLLRKPYFIPDSKRANQLFHELQKHKTHMAIAIDEHGGTAGLVTMENLIEEIMGDILDEYDDYKKGSDIILQADGSYVVGGACDLDDLADTLDIKLPVATYETVNGFIVGYLGTIPTNKEVINHALDFNYAGYLFSITDMDGKVISEVKITKAAAEVTAEQGQE